MKRFVLFSLVVAMFSFLSGCGGESAPSKVDQQKRLEQTDANMKQGMDAMKAMKKK
jgi:hypothetical protein